MLKQAQPRWKLVLAPTVVCAVAAGALAAGHMLTKDAVARQRLLFKLASVHRVLPPCDNDPGKDVSEVGTPDGTRVLVYRCVKGGKVRAVAYSLDSSRNKHRPYSGTIDVLVGIMADGSIVSRGGKPGLVVLRHSETPGLGARIESSEFQSNFIDAQGRGRNLKSGGMSCDPAGHCYRWAVKKDDPRGFVDAISGATISSRAFTEIVHRALVWFDDPGFREKALQSASNREGAPRESSAGPNETRPGGRGAGTGSKDLGESRRARP